MIHPAPRNQVIARYISGVATLLLWTVPENGRLPLTFRGLVQQGNRFSAQVSRRAYASDENAGYFTAAFEETGFFALKLDSQFYGQDWSQLMPELEDCLQDTAEVLYSELLLWVTEGVRPLVLHQTALLLAAGLVKSRESGWFRLVDLSARYATVHLVRSDQSFTVDQMQPPRLWSVKGLAWNSPTLCVGEELELQGILRSLPVQPGAV